MKKTILLVALCLFVLSQVSAEDVSYLNMPPQEAPQIASINTTNAAPTGASPAGSTPFDIVFLRDIGLIIAAATLISYFATIFKQPLIPAYIFAGILIGPMVTGLLFGKPLIPDEALIAGLSQLGITFLLFRVGTELDLSRLKEVGLDGVLLGIVQIGLVFGAGFGASILLGFTGEQAFYLGMAVAFSSTMVVVKLLSDRDELGTVYGRIILSIMLVQDIVAIMVLSLINNLGDGSWLLIVDSLIRGMGLFSIAIVISKYIAPSILRMIAKHVELVFLTSLSFVFVFGLATYILGFSPAIGGFLAGLSLAVFPYNLEIVNRITPLRDFFSILFFTTLGMQLHSLAGVLPLMVPILVFLVIAVLLKPLVVVAFAILLGYDKKTSFISGFGIGQISEFSLILVLPLGLQSSLFITLMVVTIITMMFTSYFMRFKEPLYKSFTKTLTRMEALSIRKRKRGDIAFSEEEKPENHIVLFGAHVMGESIMELMFKLNRQFVVVDNDPEVTTNLSNWGVKCIFGNAQDADVLKKANIEKSQGVISTIPDNDWSHFIVKYTKRVNPHAIVFVTAKSITKSIELYNEGADYVLPLKFFAGHEMAKSIEEVFNLGKDHLAKRKERELKALDKRRKLEIIRRIDPHILKELKTVESHIEGVSLDGIPAPKPASE